MAEYWDVAAWRESKNGKRYAVRIGYATRKTKGDGFYINLDAYPVPDKEGRVSFEIGPRRDAPARSDDELNDSIPF